METQDKNKESKTQEKFRHFDVPKYIKILSLIYIGVSIAAGLLQIFADILQQGHASLNQFNELLW